MTVLDQEQEYTLDLSYQRFCGLCQPLLARVKAVLDRALMDARYSYVSSDNFVLVGELRNSAWFRTLSYCINQVVVSG